METAKKYFGTDGIRGVVGKPPITPDFMLKLGWAAGKVLGANKGAKVLIGKDTRISGYMFESALEAGLSAAGVDIYLLGPMPTPAIAYLTRTFQAQAGIVISASHNSFEDNGIKFFSPQGTKLDDDIELAIEEQLEAKIRTVKSHELGKAERIDDAAGRYIEFCKSSTAARVRLTGMKIVIDCANGATYHIAPNVLRELGAEVIGVGISPDGFNINKDVGSTKPALLQQAVLDNHADLGIALDGDGDRVMMVDHKGELVDGDEILFVIARSRMMFDVPPPVVVGTVMSNLGMEQALSSYGIGFQRAAVGDRYVLELLRKGGYSLGGESSGHVICLDRTTTGDGVITALQVLEALMLRDATLHDLKNEMHKFPQKMINVPLESGIDIGAIASVRTAVEDAESELGANGRVLLRPSGTEPLVRVMIEGRDEQQVNTLVQQLADRVVEALDQAAAS